MLSGEEIIFSNLAPIISALLIYILLLWQYIVRMKPGLEQVKKNESNSSLTHHILDLPEFEPYWHFHPEFELTFIISGSGKRIVGDSVEKFDEGDLVLLGSDLPHTWNSFRREPGNALHRAVVFQFSRNLVPGPSQGFPEFEGISRLLDRAHRGISFGGAQVMKTGKKLEALTRSVGLGKLTQFWLILDELSKAGEYRFLASEGYAPTLNTYSGERVNNVFRYVSMHFDQDIKISQLAQLTHMTETSFSRFFKMITGETFMEYVNNIRISRACAMLAEQKEKSISQIAGESGFKSSTHFNRMFLIKKGCTPTHFRRQYFV